MLCCDASAAIRNAHSHTLAEFLASIGHVALADSNRVTTRGGVPSQMPTKMITEPPGTKKSKSNVAPSVMTIDATFHLCSVSMRGKPCIVPHPTTLSLFPGE